MKAGMNGLAPSQASSPRAVPVVELGYRSAGAFLITYVTQLTRGELFVESTALPPVGTRLTLRLSAPPATVVGLDGAVAWTRATAGPGQPTGMGVTLAPPPDALGAAVDRLAAAFGGFRILLGTAEAAPRAILGRYLRSILACTVVDLDERPDRYTDFDFGAVDLAVIDLDSSGPRGFELGDAVRQRPRPAPVLALAQLDRDRVLARRLGFEEALQNPPSFADLQEAVLRCLSRPTTTHQETKYGTLKGYAGD
jgi:CheY-like chemotaxis protein